MRASRARGPRLCALILAAAGCASPVPTVPDFTRRDAQPGDSGGGGDTGSGTGDGAVRVVDGDAGEVDGGGALDPGRCRAEAGDVITLATEPIARERDIAVAAGATRLAVAYSTREAGFENVRLVEIPATGAVLAAAESITTGSAIQRDPALAPSGNGWIVAWYGNPDGDFETYAHAWQDGRPAPGASLVRLTTRAGRDDQPAIAAMPGGALVGWVETRGAAMDQRVPVVRPLGTTGAPSAVQRDATASSSGIGRIALGPRAGGMLVGWIDSSSATPTAVVQQLGGDGTPSGTPISISTEGNADGTIDLATGASGGAITFGASVAGVRPEVRARLVDASGTPSGPERVITEPPASGRDATIASLAGGYVLAYRLLGPTPMLHVELRDASLDPVTGFDVTPVTATGGRVTIRVSGEGRMVVGWADVGPGTTTIRAARIRCD